MPGFWVLLQLRFLSTPSGWRATRKCRSPPGSIGFLSTPSGWRATSRSSQATRPCAFLSTPSGWRATPFEVDPAAQVHDFYPRPPGGGRPAFCSRQCCHPGISIHALRVEGDEHQLLWSSSGRYFYPRPPGGGRQQKRTKFSSVFAQKGEEFASLRRGKRKICRWRFKKDKFWVLIWCEGSGKSVCALASHCG